MNAYFIKRGAPAERGCIDEEALPRMVAEKRLVQDDLVWIDGPTPGWVRAMAVPGLFPEPEPKQAPAQPTANKQTRRKRKSLRRPFGRKLPLLLTLCLIGVVAAFWLPRFYANIMYGPRAETPPEPAAPTNGVAGTADTRDWSPELDNLSHLLERAELATARAMLRGIQAAGCESPELTPLIKQLRSLEADRAYALKQGRALGHGTLELAAIDPFVAAVRRLRLIPALRHQIESILTEPGVDAAQASQIMAIGLAMEDLDVVASAAAWVVAAPPSKLVGAPFWPVLEQLSESGQQRVAEQLCRALLRANPRDPRLGFELAALLCSRGRKDDALDALKEAAKYASKEAKRTAATDPRFEPIHGSRRFGRYLK